MDVLAARDQENQVHHLQASTAGKNGLKGLGAKTPGHKAPKTPFKVSLNDENAVGKAGKSVLKTNGKGNIPMTVKKDGKGDMGAFVTPAGPRSRAPLGMKTTNAKAAAFQTPAPLSSAKTQKVSPRLRRPKVKVHQPGPAEEEEDVPEIEYMPPKEVPLPDDMDDYLPRDWKFPMFEGKNANRGIWDAYHNPVEDDGRTKGERELDEQIEADRKKRDEEFDKLFNAQWEKDQAEVSRHFGIEPLRKAAPASPTKPGDPKKKTHAAPSTIKAKSAVAALSDTRKPNFAASTAATKSRIPAGLMPSKKDPKPVVAPSSTRHAVATAASKSTIGYAKGRATTTNTTARKPLSNVTKPAPFSATTRRAPLSTTQTTHTRNTSNTSTIPKRRGDFSRSSSTSTQATLVPPAEEEEEHPQRTAEEVEREMERLFLQDSDDEDADAWADNFAGQLDGGDAFDGDLEGFQMQLPEGL
ncbi:hypothetical protein CC80DRAFT_455332 [Byssothecium circinans]|uniref:Uncharacterized protein n=1 Tax=Byssothecium circinans TaxID=147558 RepID=A0A6A5TEY4_9PLEO|nr:hypothetical protein CC80DRAFT_455332 [Byssothecium circinans]